MTYEDRTLVCSSCNSEFVFTAGEQEFYAEKGLTSEPKRCKACRKARKRQQGPKKDGIYRSPAFENSAPSHQKVRGRGGRNARGRGKDYRSPGLNDKRPRRDEYRSPAFREIDVIKPEQEYRAPGFKEYEGVVPEEEYRSPAFRELDGMNINEEYRAPGFQGMAKKYLDEKPMFAIVCASCGTEAMVPVLPDEREAVYCQECYKQRKAAEAAARAEAAEAAAAEAAGAGEAAGAEVAAGESEQDVPPVETSSEE